MRILFSLALLLSVLFAPSQFLWAQNKEDVSEDTVNFQVSEDSLNVLAKEMFTSFLPNGKMNAGFAFARLLYKTLKQPGSFQYGFDSLGKQIHILYPDNKKFRIFNWLVSPDQNITRYYGIIQTADSVYPLTNYSDRLIESPTLLQDTLDRRHWFGAEYYNMITKRKDDKDYYFLFGLNINGTYSDKKILDVLSFTSDGPVFGAPVFFFPDEKGDLQTQDRILWQYRIGSAFYLDYDKEHNYIAFDHLHSRINDPLRKDTYVPTGRVDGLKWEKGEWVFHEGIVVPLKLKDGQAPVNGVIQK